MNVLASLRLLLGGGPRAGNEPLMYRVHLFNELLALKARPLWRGQRLLEIGPKDGLDSQRLASLEPSELTLIDLPEKREGNDRWLPRIPGPKRYIEGNFMYLEAAEFRDLGRYDLVWCTGVLYHNAEQLRFLRKLYKLLTVGGYLVLESSTLRNARRLRGGCFVEIHYPETYRNTGTTTHLPTAGAIKAWLQMVGFREIHDSACYAAQNRDLIGQRYACLCRKNGEEEGDLYYAKSGLNPAYRFGDST